MFDVFKMHSSLVESAAGIAAGSDIQAYNFVGDLSESTFAEANMIIMGEAASLAQYSQQSDEIMVEAAMSNPAAVDTLVENVFDTIVAKAKALWNKLVEVVKGLLAKIKAFGLRMTGQTTKWAKHMEKRIKDAKAKKGAIGFRASFHKWDESLLDNLAAITPEDAEEIDVSSKFNEWDKAVTDLKDFSGQSAQDANVLDSIKVYEKEIEKSKEELDKVKADLVKGYGDELGITMSADTVDNLMSEIQKAISGGEKTEQDLNEAMVDKMLEFVKGCAKKISNTEKAYNKMLTKLNGELKKLNEIENKIKNAKVDDKNVPSNYVNAFKNWLSVDVNTACQITSMAHNITNRCKSVFTSTCKTMASEYMSVLTKYAGVKDKEREDV